MLVGERDVRRAWVRKVEREEWFVWDGGGGMGGVKGVGVGSGDSRVGFVDEVGDSEVRDDADE